MNQSVSINVSKDEIEKYVPASVKRRRAIIALIVSECRKKHVITFEEAKEISKKTIPDASERVLNDYAKTALYILDS